MTRDGLDDEIENLFDKAEIVTVQLSRADWDRVTFAIAHHYSVTLGADSLVIPIGPPADGLVDNEFAADLRRVYGAIVVAYFVGRPTDESGRS